MWEGQEGDSARFSAQGSHDLDGDSISYAWDFGDGMKVRSTHEQQAHPYVDNGTYTVVLTVIDTHGAEDTAKAQVFIANGAPSITGTLSTPPLPAALPMSATAHVQYQDPGTADHPYVTVDWGDGISSRDTVHVYRTPGAYAVVFTVTDKDGASAAQEMSGAVWVYDLSQSHSPDGYEVIDLGTLGGADVTPYGFNNRGEVVGSSQLADGKRHPFLWRDGALTDINPAGQEVGEARAINDAGLIAGRAAGFDYPDMDLGRHPGDMPLWRDGVFSGLLSFPSVEFGGTPVKILPSGNFIVNMHDHEQPDALLVRDGIVIDLGGLSSFSHAWASDINTREQIVGSSAFQSAGANGYDYRAFLWEQGVMTQLPSLGTAPCGNRPEVQCGHAEALDITETGQIVGSSFNGTSLRAVLWDTDRTPQDLGFGDGSSRAVAINERGQIAGDGGTYDSNEAYFRDNGTVISLGSLGGGGTRVVGMNENGAVAGTSKTTSGEVHAFVWTRDAGMRDLGAGPFGGVHVGTNAIAINARGDILGIAAPCLVVYGGSLCNSWGQNRAILWRRTN